MNMRDIMNAVLPLSESVGHNGAPEVTLVKGGKATLGARTYDAYKVMFGGRFIGWAYGRYIAARGGETGGHIFNMTLDGKDFTGSKGRLIAWVEKMKSADL